MIREAREITSRGEWLDWRKSDLTASRIPALFGEHKYLTVEGIIVEMRGQSAHGDNPSMRAGRILEPAVAAAIAEEHPEWRITKATTYHRLPEHRLGATPDYWLDDDGLIQVKTVAPQEWDRWGCHPPLGYKLQTLCEMLVTGRERGVLAIMVRSPSFPLHLFDVPRHEAAEARILYAVVEFWKSLEAGWVFPPLVPGILNEAMDDGSHKDLSGSNELPVMLTEREQLKAEISGTEKRLKIIDAEIKAAIGAARTAYVPGWSLSMPVVNVKEHLVAASQYRRLNIKRVEE